MPPSNGSLAMADVVIIEPSAPLRDALAWRLQAAGFNVALFGNAPDAEAAMREATRLVLVDLGALGEELPQWWGEGTTVVIGTTDDPLEDRRDLARRLGVLVVYEKPLPIEDLAVQIATPLARSEEPAYDA